MKSRRIELHLDRIVLHGVPPGQRHRVIAALERELGQRLRRGERLPQSQERVRSEGAPAPAPEVLGAEVARAITKGGGQR